MQEYSLTNFVTRINGNSVDIGNVCSKHIIHTINFKLEHTKLP